MEIRYIAKIVIEAETALSVGSGQKGLLIDRVVAKDANDLPYIPGTSLCGVLRHSFDLLDSRLSNTLFGSGGEDGQGSRIKISAAHLIGENGKEIIEGLKNINFESGYYSYFNRLPERDHVRMTDKGTSDAEGHGKYDEQLVHKGTRFAFELELMGTEGDAQHWQNLLQLLASPTFRIGAGTRKGFGKIRIINTSSVFKVFDLRKKADLLNYLKKSSSLNFDYEGWSNCVLSENDQLPNWTKYSVTLTPQDFFLFSAGFGDADADTKPKTEQFFDWTSGKPQLTESAYLLIPATSVKGAIAHRVAYHYNKSKSVFIGKNANTGMKTILDIEKAVSAFDFGFSMDDLNLPSDSPRWKELEEQVKSSNYLDSRHWQEFENRLDEEVDKFESASLGEDNQAVQTLFGYAKDSEVGVEGLRGRVIINDTYLPYQSEKVFNHTKIDRFTNGTIDGALFQEKVAAYSNEFTLDIWVENTALEDNLIKDALENTLFDFVEGQLPLGGNTTKGHGLFIGQLEKN